MTRTMAQLKTRAQQICVALCALIWLFTGTSQSVSAESFVNGTPVRLFGTVHIYVYQDGKLHWIGDTEAAARLTIKWDKLVDITTEEIKNISVGDPILSFTLLRDDSAATCCPIYLVKRETGEAPKALHIQSIADVALFGISEANYGQFLQNKSEWEATHGLKADDLPKENLAPADQPTATATPAPTQAATPTPRPNIPVVIQEPVVATQATVTPTPTVTPTATINFATPCSSTRCSHGPQPQPTVHIIPPPGWTPPAQFTVTATPTLVATATSTETLTPTATSNPTHTATATPSPTATIAPPIITNVYRGSDGAITIEGEQLYSGTPVEVTFLYPHGLLAYRAGTYNGVGRWGTTIIIIPSPPLGHIPLSFSGTVKVLRDGMYSNSFAVPAYSTPTPATTATPSPTAAATRTPTRTAVPSATQIPGATAMPQLQTPQVWSMRWDSSTGTVTLDGMAFVQHGANVSLQVRDAGNFSLLTTVSPTTPGTQWSYGFIRWLPLTNINGQVRIDVVAQRGNETNTFVGSTVTIPSGRLAG